MTRQRNATTAPLVVKLTLEALRQLCILNGSPTWQAQKETWQRIAATAHPSGEPLLRDTMPVCIV